MIKRRKNGNPEEIAERKQQDHVPAGQLLLTGRLLQLKGDGPEKEILCRPSESAQVKSHLLLLCGKPIFPHFLPEGLYNIPSKPSFVKLSGRPCPLSLCPVSTPVTPGLWPESKAGKCIKYGRVPARVERQGRPGRPISNGQEILGWGNMRKSFGF